MTRSSRSARKSHSSNISESYSHATVGLTTPATSASSSPEPHLVSSSTSSMAGRRSTMRRSSQSQSELPLPITYTPTTHRISKAKKGKRVHACEYPGCNKVFTRAEHRRRHEVNHNPEASHRCTYPGCKKAFHRSDLLTRHMERHKLEAQSEQRHWTPPASSALLDDSASVSRCMSMDSPQMLAGTPPQSHAMSIGTIVAPGIHPDLANGCSLMWNGIDLPLQPRPATSLFQNLPESVDDSPFYSSPPETCPSPLSDVAFTTMPSQPGSISSISSLGSSLLDQYPKTILNADVTSSPQQMPTPRRWDNPDAGMPPSHMVAMSMEESLIQHPAPCHYPSPSWSGTDCLYDEQVQSLTQFQPISWKQWDM
ncbi:Krueppel-like factor 3 [Penicillium ucsense]|uniref:Krueppel-like factor 3 n=1 Tax=Penicillium ucsense TaxID=2839758 RepID=A0A8J8WHG6_9EURO|nr:Krueppel-like factor 3 [Penicillium ucsense]KAF7736407.1 Krueppel-like factor 3 [Penicillium ucsense]